MNKIKLILLSLIIIAVLSTAIFAYQFRVNLVNNQYNLLSLQAQALGVNLDSNLRFGIFDSTSTIEDKTNKIKSIINTSKIQLKKDININAQTIKSLSTLLTKLEVSLSNNKLDPNLITIRNIEDQKSLINNYRTYLRDAIKSKESKNNYINPLWAVNVPEFVNKMSIEDLIGQVMMIGVDNPSLTTTQISDLKAFNPGGVILMGKNVITQAQTTSLTAQIQSSNPTNPLLISTDQEGGDVKRLNWENMKPQSQWLSMPETELCQQAKSRASIMKSSGINMNLSPVTDLSSSDKLAFINNRTISPTPTEVSRVIQSYRKCFDKQVFSTLKHFPGHGMVSGDSHKVVPSNAQVSYESWLASDAIPFKENLDAQFILNAHILIPQVDNKITSLSKQWIEDVLRSRLGYKGVVITDDMQQLQNITKQDPTQLAVQALEAGNDLLLYLPTATDLTQLKSNLINHFSKNRSMIESKVIRILESKQLII
jgi:beta-glucosidase-like glycosyl hydrolase